MAFDATAPKTNLEKPANDNAEKITGPLVEATARGVILLSGDKQIEVQALSAQLIRIRHSTKADATQERSFAITERKLSNDKVRVHNQANLSVIETDRLQVKVQHSPFRVEVLDHKGNSLDKDDGLRGTQFLGESFTVAKRLRKDEQVYGFGEKTGRLNKRGWAMGGYHYTMWNSDTFGYDSSTDPIYVSVPFYMVLRDGVAHGIFLDNSFRTSFDIGKNDPDLLQFSGAGGELDYYFIAGPTPKEVIQRYTELTGRMSLPPMWSLGFHQSRWGYFPESKFKLLADTFRSKQIPADVLWLDIDYQEGFKPFTWDYQHFPKPKEMIQDLRAQGFQVVTIVDPHPKKEVGYHVYDQGLSGNHFVKNPDGSLFEGPVWPSGAKKNPGNSVFPDFTKKDTRLWWGDLHKDLLSIGVAGIWNDMNEPAVWIPPTNTMPLDVQHENDGRPTTQSEIHNVYGMLHTRSTFEALQRLRPDERPFVLTRASFAGGQKYSAVWPGDNVADWASLRQSLPMLMGMGLSGFSFVGADIGGFAGFPTPELFTRWLQAAVFSPFMRAHTALGTPDQEPWSFGAQYEAINKKTIELRYQLLPHIYQVMEESARTGIPALRPLMLEFPDDAQTYAIDDQYMFGDRLLVAPVLVEAATERSIYLPKGDWFDYWSGQSIQGGQTIQYPVNIHSLPIFVRAGSFLFSQETVQHVGEMDGKMLTISVFPAQASSASLYQDDGHSMAYQTGVFSRRQWTQSRTTKKIELTLSKTQGRYKVPARMLQVRVVSSEDGEAFTRSSIKNVKLNGSILKKIDSSKSKDTNAELAKAVESGGAFWVIDEKNLVIYSPDSDKEMRFTIAQ